MTVLNYRKIPRDITKSVYTSYVGREILEVLHELGFKGNYTFTEKDRNVLRAIYLSFMKVKKTYSYYEGLVEIGNLIELGYDIEVELG